MKENAGKRTKTHGKQRQHAEMKRKCADPNERKNSRKRKGTKKGGKKQRKGTKP
jgi:hypothetical protein